MTASSSDFVQSVPSSNRQARRRKVASCLACIVGASGLVMGGVVAFLPTRVPGQAATGTPLSGRLRARSEVAAHTQVAPATVADATGDPSYRDSVWPAVSGTAGVVGIAAGVVGIAGLLGLGARAKAGRRFAAVRRSVAEATAKTEPPVLYPGAEDRLGVEAVDYLELVVGNAKQAAAFFQACLGFQPVAQCGLETGLRDRCSYVLRQGSVVLVLTSPLLSGCALSEHLAKHGDGVRCVALEVRDARAAYKAALAAGAEHFLAPTSERDEHGEVVRSGIRAYADTVHLFIERKRYKGPFLPGFQRWAPAFQPPSVGIRRIDHVVTNVGWNQMEGLAEFYRRVFGMTQLVSFDDKDISTDFTALRSVVMTTRTGRVKFPINEPARGLRKSQIEEFIDFYGGAGVQHVALATDDILATVAALRQRGVEFLQVPGEYYDRLTERVGPIQEDIRLLKQHQILVDRDDRGYMLQIFTRPMADRPTMFFEIIQRRGSESFGKGNFKALFESIEEEQRSRGTL